MYVYVYVAGDVQSLAEIDFAYCLLELMSRKEQVTHHPVDLTVTGSRQ